MTHVSTATLSEALRWRYATKKFDDTRKIAPEIWAALEQALVLAPSSFGLQPWKFIVVRDPATLARLSAAAWGQKQPVDCSHFVVFSVRKNYDLKDLEHFIHRTVEVRGVPAELRGEAIAGLKGYSDVIAASIDRASKGGYLDAWMGHQVYIALGQFMTAAALLGVDTCPMEGIEPAKFDEILGLKALGYGTLCAAAAGYRSADDKYASMPKVRFKTEEVILHA
jgi:nitroreductase